VDQNRDQWWALVNTVMNLQDPQNSEMFFSSWVTMGFSRSTHLHGVYRLEGMGGEEKNKVKCRSE
jgi:hypothetical protein